MMTHDSYIHIHTCILCIYAYIRIYIYIYKCILQHPAIACTSCIKDTVGPNLANPLICWISHYSSQSVRVFTFLSVIPLPDWQVKVNWRIPYYTDVMIVTVLLGRRVIHGNYTWNFQGLSSFSFTLFHQISQLPCCKWSNTSSDHSVFGNDFCYVQKMIRTRNNTSNIFPMQPKILWNSIWGTMLKDRPGDDNARIKIGDQESYNWWNLQK